MLLSIRWQVVTIIAVLAALLFGWLYAGQSMAVAKPSSLNLAQQVESLPDVHAQPASAGFDYVLQQISP